MTSTVTYANDLTEPLNGIEDIEGIFGSDLQGLRSIWIEVVPDRDAYEAEALACAPRTMRSEGESDRTVIR